MPRTKKGEKILKAMQKRYGKAKGKRVYYGSIVKGRITGAEGAGGTGKLKKAQATYRRRHSSKRSKAKEAIKKIYG